MIVSPILMRIGVEDGGSDELNHDEMEIEKTKDTQDVSNTDDSSSHHDSKGNDNDHGCDNNFVENNSLHGSFNNADQNSNQSDSDSEVHFDRSALPNSDDISHPQWFYGFWGQRYNDYRRVGPHDGYDIIARWARHKNHVPKEQQVEGSALVEGEEESIVAKQIRSITNKLELGDDDNDTCCSGEIDEP